MLLLILRTFHTIQKNKAPGVAKILLRSGNLDNVLPLGENGRLVYQCAFQLRETLRLRNQAQVADHLAIPQLNQAGNRLDWYSPLAGKVRSWNSASSSVRRAALKQLRQAAEILSEIAQQSSTSSLASHRLFASLLAKSLQFPEANYVYLVDDRPVITFWGFSSLTQKGNPDALDNLPLDDDDEPLVNLAPAPPPIPAVTVPPASIPSAEPEPPLSTPEVPGGRRLRPVSLLLWGVPLLAVVAVAALLTLNKARPPAQPPIPPAEKAVAKAPAVKLPQMTDGLPTGRATLDSTPRRPPTLAIQANTAREESNTPTVSAKPAKDDLVIPADAAKVGSVRFMNGNWKMSIRDPQSAPDKVALINLRLAIGKGMAMFSPAKGVTCRRAVTAAFTASGALAVGNAVKVRCSDGSLWSLPQLSCSQSPDQPAICTGQYSDGSELSMSVKRK